MFLKHHNSNTLLVNIRCLIHDGRWTEARALPKTHMELEYLAQHCHSVNIVEIEVFEENFHKTVYGYGYGYGYGNINEYRYGDRYGNGHGHGDGGGCGYGHGHGH